MSVFRVPKRSNFTVMSNVHLRDTSLSLKAKGLLSYMLSNPDNWIIACAVWPVSAVTVSTVSVAA